MLLKKVIGVLMLLGFVSSCNNEGQNVQGILKGLWKLDKYESLDTVSGAWINTQSRLNYTGYILYDGLGHMATQIQPPGFYEGKSPNVLDSLTADEMKLLLQSELKSFSYFANYKVLEEGKIIEHYRISSNNPAEYNTTVKRYLDIRGDTLILTAFEPIGGKKTRLRWVRQ